MGESLRGENEVSAAGGEREGETALGFACAAAVDAGARHVVLPRDISHRE